MHFPSVEDITPTEFEMMVKSWFESAADSMKEFKANHQEPIKGSDGEFVFDVTARFTAFGGAEFLIVCECKKHKNPIERSVVQILNDKKRSIGAHKGFVIATAPFQSGARKYALANGIALCEVYSGDIAFIQASSSVESYYPDKDADPYVGKFPVKLANGSIYDLGLVSSQRSHWLSEFLKQPIGEEY